jgi:hypothetical protein
MTNMSIAEDRRWSAKVETLGFLKPGQRPVGRPIVPGSFREQRSCHGGLWFLEAHPA